MPLAAKELFLRQKRLPGGRKAVTVCIAGINHSNPQPYIIAVCDRRISFFGGWATAEGAMKITGINKDWSVMFSGPVSQMVGMIDAMKESAKKFRLMGFRQFAYLCREVYRRERKPLIESEILGDYDIENYAEYMELKKSAPTFYEEVKKKIAQHESEWNLLFAGFDKQRNAHIFTISDCGKISFCDQPGYAAIGSGGLHAVLSLSSYQFRKQIPFSHSIFGIVSAKFAAESAADGVGNETVLTILEPRMNVSPVFTEGTVKELRTLWNALPRFPGEEATKKIWYEMNGFQAWGWLKGKKSPRPTKAELNFLAGLQPQAD